VLYKDEAVGFDLNGIVPASHIRVTVRTAVSRGFLLIIRDCTLLIDSIYELTETHRCRLSPQDPSDD